MHHLPFHLRTDGEERLVGVEPGVAGLRAVEDRQAGRDSEDVGDHGDERDRDLGIRNGR